MVTPNATTLAAVIVFGAVLALVGVNIVWTLQFWSVGENAWVYQIFGVCMIAIELTGLVGIAELRRRGERRRANVWAVVFAMTLVFNTVVDFSAIITRSATSIEERARERAMVAAARTQEVEQSARVTALVNQLHGGERPLEAYRAELSAESERRDRYVRSGRLAPQRLLDRIAGLEARVATSIALADARRSLEAARAAIAEYGDRSVLPPHYIGLSRMFRAVGVQTSPEDIEAWFSLLIAAVVKVVVVVGPWVFMVFTRKVGSSPIAAGDQNEPSMEAVVVAAPQVRGQNDSFEVALAELETGMRS